MENHDFALLLRTAKTIAIAGLSPDAARPSHAVAHYLQTHGYRIVPVNPACAGKQILGELCYAGLEEAVHTLAQSGVRIDILDCFRRTELVAALVDDAIALQIPVVWMQLGVRDEQAAARARAAGIRVVMDRCLEIEHAALVKSGKI